MSSGVCKFCTYLFFLQFSFLKYIVNMTSYHCSVLLKQFSHLSLRKPYSLILQPDINLRLSVLCLIDYYLIILHSS